MRIVIDLQGAQTASRFRGIGRYTVSFVQAVLRNKGDNEVILVASGLFPETLAELRQAFAGLLPPENFHIWYVPDLVDAASLKITSDYQAAELIREAFIARLKPDIIHITSLFEGHLEPAVTSIKRFDKTTPISVVLYDLIPLLNPENYFAPDSVFKKFYLSKINYLKQADIHLAISAFAREEGLQHLPLNPDRVINMSAGLDEHFQPLQISSAIQQQLKEKFNIQRPFLLYTGGADERKNLPRLLEAYAELTLELQQQYQLLFVGRIPEIVLAQLRQQIKNLGLEAEVIFTGYVSDAELIQLYNLCEALVFPSWHEGFGLPALEAMACGVPAIAANRSSLPEVLGTEEALFDPFSVTSIAEKITQVLTDKELRQRLVEHGLEQAKKFTWDATAKTALAAWQQLVNEQQKLQAQSKPVAKQLLTSDAKLKLALVTPWPPEQTGIAGYSADLLPALEDYYAVEVITAADVEIFKSNASSYDRVVYQLGNSVFHTYMLPLMQEILGVVVLHDFYLSGLKSYLEAQEIAPTLWQEACYASHGYPALVARQQNLQKAVQDYPVNLVELQQALGVLVHSDYSKQLAQQWYGSESAANWQVIPLVREKFADSQISAEAKIKAKQILGFASDDFLICSFGLLDETKQNKLLLESWLASPLAEEKSCYLVFVGQNGTSEYCQQLEEQVKLLGLNKRVRITGFADEATYTAYLTAADLAVQLRTLSRGETSGAVLDCMNYGLATIVNANGSMAELNKQAVWLLPDVFSQEELTAALIELWQTPALREQLGQAARKIIQQKHSPAHCAKLYAQAIEKFYAQVEYSAPHLIQQLAAENLLPSQPKAVAPSKLRRIKNKLLKSNSKEQQANEYLLALAAALALNHPVARPKNLYLDITATLSNDLKTGIERVVRSLVLALIKQTAANQQASSSLQGYRIEPVYLVQESGRWLYRHACNYTLDLLDCSSTALIDEVADPQAGDKLLVMDISGQKLIDAHAEGLHSAYQQRGVKIYSLVYDLLPLRLPEVFPSRTEADFAAWLRVAISFDGAVGISNTVKNDLAAWLQEEKLVIPAQILPEKSSLVLTKQAENQQLAESFYLSYFHLGADLAASAPSKGLPEEAAIQLKQFQAQPTFLMVGTLEPRKGYLQALEAFTQLWNEGCAVNLVIVGQEGWRGLAKDERRDIPATLEVLTQHSQLNKQLFWLQGISDEYLNQVYKASSCLLAASYGEGFGLPLIEAARHQLPLLVRDLPIFREVAGQAADYFTAANPNQLAQAIKNWLAQTSARNKAKASNAEHQITWQTWEQSAQQLAQQLAEAKNIR